MQIFKTNKKSFIKNFIVGLLISITGMVFLFALFKQRWPLTAESLMLVTVITILKVGDILTQFIVKEIHIDSETGQMRIFSKSIFSGEKEKKLDLQEVYTEFSSKQAWNIIRYSDTVLKIYVNKRDHFRLTRRYGFSANTLREIDRAVTEFHQL